MALTLALSLTLTPTLTLTLTTDPSPKPTRCPPRLEEWERLEDGSVRGVLYGVAGVRDGGIRATVPAIPAEVGCSMAEAEQWCVRTTPNPNPYPYPNPSLSPNPNPNQVRAHPRRRRLPAGAAD